MTTLETLDFLDTILRHLQGTLDGASGLPRYPTQDDAAFRASEARGLLQNVRRDMQQLTTAALTYRQLDAGHEDSVGDDMDAALLRIRGSHA